MSTTELYIFDVNCAFTTFGFIDAWYWYQQDVNAVESLFLITVDIVILMDIFHVQRLQNVPGEIIISVQLECYL